MTGQLWVTKSEVWATKKNTRKRKSVEVEKKEKVNWWQREAPVGVCVFDVDLLCGNRSEENGPLSSLSSGQ